MTSKAKKLAKLAIIHELVESVEAEVSREDKKGQREQAKEWLMRRDDPNSWCQLYPEIEESDRSKFLNVFRLTPEIFADLLHRIKPLIEKQDTHMRQTIPAKLRLMVGLRWKYTL